MISRHSLSCIHWWEFVYTRMLSGCHFFMTSFHVLAIGSMTQRFHFINFWSNFPWLFLNWLKIPHFKFPISSLTSVIFPGSPVPVGTLAAVALVKTKRKGNFMRMRNMQNIWNLKSIKTVIILYTSVVIGSDVNYIWSAGVNNSA